ncbi:MAG: DNA translocase FtsK [Calditrichaeota bacterium]|nr:MAG: DNA translocase FtsK [Calditrichota bacterium]MBL1207702.1 DNA translocase FtsK [Calditrichota bacterium]NOG47537.1 DNA translocase FtsK [Calditrichota bacterium]
MKKKKNKKDSIGFQLFGLLLMGIAIFMFLAIVSFNLDDPVNMNIADNPVVTHNWFGQVGAAFSHFLMQWTFGYAALIFPVLMFLVGISVFKNEPILDYGHIIVKLSAWSILVSIFLAFPDALKTQGNLIEYYPSGLIGGWLASNFVLYLGKIGSSLLLLLMTVLMLFVSMRSGISSIVKYFQDSFVAVSQFISELVQSLTSRFKIWKENRVLKKAEKKKVIEESKEPEFSIEEKPEPPVELEIEDPVPHVEPELFSNQEDLFSSIDGEENNSQTSFEPEETEEISSETDFELKEAVQEEQLDYDDLVKESIARFKFPSIDLLNNPPADRKTITKEELKSNAELLEYKLLDYGVKAKVVRVTAGPVITLYELQPAPGVKVNSIVNLENDLALAMEARGIRIIAPIPGKAAVGIEIPNKHPQTVYLKSLIRSEKFSHKEFELPLAVGKAINGESFVVDLVKMPHLLIAGATGAGKSVGINTIICSLLYSVDPGKVKFVMVDPKKLELSLYAEMKEHYLLWRPDLDEDVITKPNNAVSMLNTMVLEMERRMNRMHTLSVRNIREYNAKVLASPKIYKNTEHQQMPYIVVLIDELADLMMVASKDVELPIARLAQMARAGGIHMIVATQRPSVDVITGLIKANLPARLAYQVATKVDSRTILDANGAEQLLGNGDLLFKLTGTAKAVRLQNPFVATEEVEQIINHIKKQPKLPYYSLPQPTESRRDSFDDAMGDDRDSLYEDARAIVVQSQSGSISLLQRRLKIGYSRAARLIDQMEEEGIVGAAIGGKPREVLMTLQELGSIS